MENLKMRIRDLLNEIEFTHLKEEWVKQLIDSGVEKSDAYKWVAEIGHVVDEYERSLRFMVDLLQTNTPSSAAQELESWVAYTRDMTIWKLSDVTNELQGLYEKYLPPEPDDDDELS